MSPPVTRALFLDRDGTLIHDAGYLSDPVGVALVPEVAALRAARDELGFRLVVVSNQSGVARGLISPAEADAVQARVVSLLALEGIVLDGAYFCFHGPDDGCKCRKPAPGLLHQAAAELALDLGSSIMVGDKPSDVEAGAAAGCGAVAFGDTRHRGALASFSSWNALVDWLAVTPAHRSVGHRPIDR